MNAFVTSKTEQTRQHISRSWSVRTLTVITLMLVFSSCSSLRKTAAPDISSSHFKQESAATTSLRSSPALAAARKRILGEITAMEGALHRTERQLIIQDQMYRQITMAKLKRDAFAAQESVQNHLGRYLELSTEMIKLKKELIFLRAKSDKVEGRLHELWDRKDRFLRLSAATDDPTAVWKYKKMYHKTAQKIIRMRRHTVGLDRRVSKKDNALKDVVRKLVMSVDQLQKARLYTHSIEQEALEIEQLPIKKVTRFSPKSIRDRKNLFIKRFWLIAELKAKHKRATRIYRSQRAKRNSVS